MLVISKKKQQQQNRDNIKVHIRYRIKTIDVIYCARCVSGIISIMNVHCQIFQKQILYSKSVDTTNTIVLLEYIYNICTLSENIKYICTSFRNRQKGKHVSSSVTSALIQFPFLYVALRESGIRNALLGPRLNTLRFI